MSCQSLESILSIGSNGGVSTNPALPISSGVFDQLIEMYGEEARWFKAIKTSDENPGTFTFAGRVPAGRSGPMARGGAFYVEQTLEWSGDLDLSAPELSSQTVSSGTGIPHGTYYYAVALVNGLGQSALGGKASITVTQDVPETDPGDEAARTNERIGIDVESLLEDYPKGSFTYWRLYRTKASLIALGNVEGGNPGGDGEEALYFWVGDYSPSQTTVTDIKADDELGAGAPSNPHGKCATLDNIFAGASGGWLQGLRARPLLTGGGLSLRPILDGALAKVGDINLAAPQGATDAFGKPVRQMAIEIGDRFVFLRHQERHQERIKRGDGQDDLLTHPFAAALTLVMTTGATQDPVIYQPGVDYELVTINDSGSDLPGPSAAIRWMDGGTSPEPEATYTVEYAFYPSYVVDGLNQELQAFDSLGSPLPRIYSLSRQHPSGNEAEGA